MNDDTLELPVRAPLELQFVRIDLGEVPQTGRWTGWVGTQVAIHSWSCDYPPCFARSFDLDREDR